MTTDDLELVDLDSQIRAAERAGYTATVEEFGGKYSPGWHGILLNPGRIVFSIGQFAQFVADGCKDPARYQAGEGFQSVLNKDISEVLADLYASRSHS